MESMVLGTFYPLDIKGDMPGCVITNRKINAETHTSEISFSSNHIFKEREKKKAIANKNDCRTGGFTKLEQRTSWDQAQRMNTLGSVLGQFPAPSHTWAPPRDDWKQTYPPIPRRATPMSKHCACLWSFSRIVPSPPIPLYTTLGLRPWKTSEISRSSLFPPCLYLLHGRCLGCFPVRWERGKTPWE